MKKIYVFLISTLMILCTACSNGGEASSITNSPPVNEAVPTDKADIPELAFTTPDPQYSALLARTMMTLGLNGVEGSWNNCAIQSDGALWNWSGNETQKVMDDVVAFSSNDYNVLAIKSDASLWKFEREERFDGSMLDGRVDGDPIYIMDDVIAVSAERFFSMAIRSDGSLWAWGANNFGQLGDGTTETRQEPVKIMEDVASVSTSDSNMMAIKSDGSLWAWGANSCGQLGDGTTDRRNRPVKIMENVVTVSPVGGLYSMALCSDGTLWTWGVNPNIPLDAETMKRGETPLSPVKVMDDVVSFSTASTIGGESFALAICSNGSLWTWGRNYYGQLGTGNRQYSSEPVHILDNIVYARAFSDQFAMAIGEDEGVWVWGNGMDVLIPQQNSHSDYGINAPFRVDLDNSDSTEVTTKGIADTSASATVADFVGTYSYDASYENPDGGWINHYHSLEISMDNTDLLVTYTWRGNYLFDHVRVSPSSLTGNTLVFDASVVGSTEPEIHSLTYLSAKDSPIGRDTIYIDDDETMPFVRE